MWSATWGLEQWYQEVRIGSGSLAEVGGECGAADSLPAALIVSDSIVAPLYGEALLKSFSACGIRSEIAVIAAGEASKTLENAHELFDRLASLHLGRDGLIVALGGGVVSDLAGFVAATWLRGVEFVICPTSLEAALDAAIGGKTGVNHPSGKNLIGAFHPASRVFIDPLCLRSLSRRDLIAGLAESIKHALIADEAFLAWHENHREAVLSCDPAAMEELIARNVTIKMDIVASDFRERTGGRARLNLGHTLGHAIEAACGYRLRHGECVALGTIAVARISRAMGLLDTNGCDRVERVLADYRLPKRSDQLPDAETLVGFVAIDKKAARTRPRWVLLDGIGRTVIRDDVPAEAIRWAIESLR